MTSVYSLNLLIKSIRSRTWILIFMAFETLNSISGPVYYVRRFSKIVDIINVVAAWSILFLCNGAINKD